MDETAETDPAPGLIVAGVQCELVWEDPAANRRALEPEVARAADRGAELIALPETWPTGFSMATDRIAEQPGGPSERWMLEQAARHDVLVCGTVPQRDHGREKARNRFLAAFPDGRSIRYDKVHPFGLGGEADAYEGGDAFTTFRRRGVRITPLVCYDLRFAECFTSRAVDTDLFVVVANWPAARVAHWDALLTARAIETQAYVLGVNRVGVGGGIEYCGHSRLVDPLGETTADLPHGEPGLVTARVDLTHLRDVRHRLPFLRDRRPDLYGRNSQTT